MIYVRDFQDKKEYYFIFSYEKSILFLCRFVGVLSLACAVVSGEFHLVFVLVENVGIVELSAKIAHYALDVFLAK